jgi:predicted DNA-binding transcriptional regulator AlpA
MRTERERLLSEHEVSDILAKLSLRTLRRWRQEGRGPAYVKVGRKVMYRPSDVQAWIDEHTIRRGKNGAP